MARPRDSRKEQYWRRTLAQWRASDLSVRAFCERLRLNEASFYRWRRLLAQRAHPGQPPTPRPQPAAPSPRGTTPPPPLFLQLDVAPGAAAPPPTPLEIVLPRGPRLRVPPGFDPHTLRQVLAALEDRPC